MGERLRRWLGLPDPIPDADQLLEEANLRLGFVVACLGVILSVVMICLLAARVGLTASSLSFSWHASCIALYLLELVAGLNLAHVARPAIGAAPGTLEDVDHRRTTRAVLLFILACTAVGMVMSYLDFRVGEQATAFYTVMIVCSCAFVLRPSFSLPYVTASFALFYCAIAAARGVTANLAIHYWALWALLQVVSVARYAAYLRVAHGEREARRASTHDELTGLPNRAALRERFGSYVGRPLFCALIDIDDFKNLNDLYGRKACNKALQAFAGTLKDLGGGIEAYRYGGDQFLLIGPDQGEATDLEMLRSLSSALSSIEVAGTWMALFFSCGYCCGKTDAAADVRAMLRLAEAALADAKHQGKNRACGRQLAEAGQAEAPGRPQARAGEELDALTGLPTMATFRARAAQALHARSGYEEGPALVYFNIENFKGLNRAYGFEGGDAFLRTIARSIAEAFPGRLVARFGEDHFMALVDSSGLSARLEQVHERAHGFQRGVPIELECGIYIPDAGEWDIGACCDKAKLACDSLKGRTDEVWRFYDEELGQAAQRQEYIADHIDQAVAEGWIEVFYQPIIRIQTGALCGMEALARWHDPTLGYLQPADFIGTLEQRQLIHKLDLSVIRQVCARLHDLLAAGAPVVPVSLNLSRLDFELCDVKEALEIEVGHAGIPHDLIDVEITESAFAGGPERIRHEVDALKELGYHVWMDDFGSGYSSFSALKGYGFDVIKMDRLFLIDFDEHPESRTILGSVVSMAKQMGIQTLCEGVETQEQLDFLASIGCEKAQGYLFSKPLGYHELMSSLRARGFAIERPGERAYFDRTGQVNLLGPSVDEGGRPSVQAMNAMAVVDLDDGKATFLSTNDAFRELLDRMGWVADGPDGRPRAARVPAAARSRFVAQLEHARDDGEDNAADYAIADQVFTLRARCIARAGQRSAFELLGRDMLGHGATAGKASEAMLDALCMTFARVDLLALDGSRAENLYLPSARYRKAIVADSAPRSLARYAEKNVDEDDRPRFLDLYDLDSLARRLDEAEAGYLSGLFRTRDEDGGFSWQLYLLVPVELPDGRYVLSCVRDFDPSQLKAMPQGKEPIPARNLWQTSLGLIPVGLFWKDARRRFVGVSQAFLDYYGLSSVRQVAGKTDDDMGWHIDPDPFDDDERAVLEEGAVVRGARGLCIRQGEVRNIQASKVPVYVDGEIVGLLGYFQDVTDVLRAQADPEADGGALTGGVLDIENFNSVLAAYQIAFERRGRDFAYIRVTVSNAHAYDGLYGAGFASRLCGAVVDAMRAYLGNAGVIHHQSGANLAVVKQIGRPQELAEICQDLRAVAARIAEVDGKPCAAEVALGGTRWSQARDLARMRRAAETLCDADAQARKA